MFLVHTHTYIHIYAYQYLYTKYFVEPYMYGTTKYQALCSNFRETYNQLFLIYDKRMKRSGKANI